MPSWWNGRHGRLKIFFFGVPVRVRQRVPKLIPTTNKIGDPMNGTYKYLNYLNRLCKRSDRMSRKTKLKYDAALKGYAVKDFVFTGNNASTFFFYPLDANVDFTQPNWRSQVSDRARAYTLDAAIKTLKELPKIESLQFTAWRIEQSETIFDKEFSKESKYVFPISFKWKTESENPQEKEYNDLLDYCEESYTQKEPTTTFEEFMHYMTQTHERWHYSIIGDSHIQEVSLTVYPTYSDKSYVRVSSYSNANEVEILDKLSKRIEEIVLAVRAANLHDIDTSYLVIDLHFNSEEL